MSDRQPTLPNNGQLSTSEVCEVLSSIHTRLDHLIQAIKRKEGLTAVEQQAKEEWRTVAIVLDRICFIIFIFLVLITAVSIFAGIPYENKHIF